MPSVLQKLIEVQSSVVAACMGEQEMQWHQWLTKPRPQVQVSRRLINAQLTEGRPMKEELYGDSKLENLQEFRHLGETLLLGADVCLL